MRWGFFLRTALIFSVVPPYFHGQKAIYLKGGFLKYDDYPSLLHNFSIVIVYFLDNLYSSECIEEFRICDKVSLYNTLKWCGGNVDNLYDKSYLDIMGYINSKQMVAMIQINFNPDILLV